MSVKIEQRGVVITEVPGFESITVQAVKPGQCNVLLQSAYGSTKHPWAFSIQELTTLRDALTEALRQAALIMGTGRPGAANLQNALSEWAAGTPGQREPRVWGSGSTHQPGPAVERVEDLAGDIWKRVDDDDDLWSYEGGIDIRTWVSLAQSYGPLTEVLPEIKSQ